MEKVGFKFRVEKPVADEDYPAEIAHKYVPEYLAKKKAESFNLKAGQLLVTADTIVIFKNKILEKPQSEDEAFEMLRRLSGKEHSVVTGVCIKSEDRLHAFSDSAQVGFMTLSDDEIHHYIESDSPFDKAGAYGIQDWIGLVGVRYVRGNFYTIMGLPVHMLYQEIKKLKV